MLESIKKLESSAEFREYKKESPEAFLVHVFYMLDEANENCVQAGYYNPKNDRITTFLVEDDKITRNPEAEVFKEQETLMNPLVLSKVKLEVQEAVEIADSIQKEKYAGHCPIRKIAILQHLEMGQLWNITFVTESFKTLNIKIDANSKNVLSDKLLSIVEFGK